MIVTDEGGGTDQSTKKNSVKCNSLKTKQSRNIYHIIIDQANIIEFR